MVDGHCLHPCLPGMINDRSFEVHYPPIVHGHEKIHLVAFSRTFAHLMCFHNNYLNCSLTMEGCVFSQDVSLKELAPSGDDSFELILCLAKLAADIFLADLAFSLAEEFDDEEFVEIPSSELDLGITGLWS